MSTTTQSRPPLLEGDVEGGQRLPAPDETVLRMRQAILDGDRATADEHWDTASLLRISAHMIRQMVAAGALAVI